jgi:hypothetical protein
MLNNCLYKVLDVVVDGAKDKVLLFGLLGNNIQETLYFQKKIGTYQFLIKKSIVPNGYARLDVLYLNEQAIGSIQSIRFTEQSYHMTSFFLANDYRSRNVKATLPGFYAAEPNGDQHKNNLSHLLLSSYLQDIVQTLKMHVTLEVKNGNSNAWKLYEKPLIESNKSECRGFQLLSQKQIENYAHYRNKKIKKFHPLERDGNVNGIGVQWTDIPDYGEHTIRWSVNRIYMIGDNERPFLSFYDARIKYKYLIKRILTIMLYGQVWQYVIFKFKNVFSKLIK